MYYLAGGLPLLHQYPYSNLNTLLCPKEHTNQQEYEPQRTAARNNIIFAIKKVEIYLSNFWINDPPPFPQFSVWSAVIFWTPKSNPQWIPQVLPKNICDRPFLSVPKVDAEVHSLLNVQSSVSSSLSLDGAIVNRRIFTKIIWMVWLFNYTAHIPNTPRIVGSMSMNALGTLWVVQDIRKLHT